MEGAINRSQRGALAPAPRAAGRVLRCLYHTGKGGCEFRHRSLIGRRMSQLGQSRCLSDVGMSASPPTPEM